MRTPITALAATLALLTPAVCAGAAPSGVPLERVAARAGYQYHWLGPERSLSLSRDGIAIVLRPGDAVYEVNNHVEIAEPAPRYAHGDLVVSAALAAHLTALARRAARAPARRGRPAATATAVTAPMHGSIQLEARPLPGSESLVVEGQVPPNAPLTITLLASLSPEIPVVVLSRHDVQPDVDGRFGVVIPVASDYLRGSTIRVLATSAPGIAPASAQVTLHAPRP